MYPGKAAGLSVACRVYVCQYVPLLACISVCVGYDNLTRHKYCAGSKCKQCGTAYTAAHCAVEDSPASHKHPWRPFALPKHAPSGSESGQVHDSTQRSFTSLHWLTVQLDSWQFFSVIYKFPGGIRPRSFYFCVRLLCKCFRKQEARISSKGNAAQSHDRYEDKLS